MKVEADICGFEIKCPVVVAMTNRHEWHQMSGANV